MTPRPNSFFACALALLIAIALSGCAGPRAYREAQALLAEGQTEQGLAKLEAAVKLEPRNVEYRIALATQRTLMVNRLISSAEQARREGRFSDAEKIYRQVQGLDAENAMARQGMTALLMARRHRQATQEVDALIKQGGPAHLKEAQEKLRQVLSENPSHKDALNLKARLEEVRAKEAQPEVKLAATFRKPITLEFRDAPIKSIFEMVAKVSGLNFFYDKDIRPDLKATVFAKNTTIEDALQLLLVTNQLEQKVLNENSILIYPSTPQKLKEYQTLSVRSFYLTNADVKAVSNTIKTILKTKDMVIDERLGIIILRDTPAAIRMAERIVALQDLSDPEVMLDVEILEIKRSRLLELGIQWPSQLTLAPLQVGGAPLTLANLENLSRTTTQATLGNMTLNARAENQSGNILANPRIRVRNKEKAKVQIGDRVPVITTTSTSTGFVSESVNYVDVGLKLEVEPTIYLDEEVSIKINLEVSNLVREILSKSGTLSYQIGTRGANTVLRLKDGETQILAGLISDEDRSSANKVPGLGELPVAGRLFGSQKDDSQRSEILLSITPRVVRSIRRPDMINAEFESGTESSVGGQGLRLSAAEAAPTQGKEEAKGDAAPSNTAPASAATSHTVPSNPAPAIPTVPLTQVPTTPPSTTLTPVPLTPPALTPSTKPAAEKGPAHVEPSASPAATNAASTTAPTAATVPAATTLPASSSASSLPAAPSAIPIALAAPLTGALPLTTNAAAAMPATTASSSTAFSSTAVSARPLNLSWHGPAQVKVGEQFSVVLKLNTQQPVRGMPVLIGFDPQALQVVSVQEADFFKQGHTPTHFNQRVDAAQGKVFVALVRQGTMGRDAAINGSGGVVTLTFKAIKATPAAKLRLLSATPEPEAPVTLPAEHALRLVP